MRNFLKTTVAVIALALPVLGWAQGKIAVVDLQEAILQTDLAQQRLNDVRNQDDYKADKAEFDRLKKEFDELVKDCRPQEVGQQAGRPRACDRKAATG